VTEQDEMVQVIDQRGEEITHNVEKAQDEIGGAVEKARSARRKKWWCLLIVREYSPILSYYCFTFSLRYPSSPGILLRELVPD